MYRVLVRSSAKLLTSLEMENIYMYKYLYTLWKPFGNRECKHLYLLQSFECTIIRVCNEEQTLWKGFGSEYIYLLLFLGVPKGLIIWHYMVALLTGNKTRVFFQVPCNCPRKNTSVPASAKVRFTSNWQSKRPVLPVDSQSLQYGHIVLHLFCR